MRSKLFSLPLDSQRPLARGDRFMVYAHAVCPCASSPHTRFPTGKPQLPQSPPGGARHMEYLAKIRLDPKLIVPLKGHDERELAVLRPLAKRQLSFDDVADLLEKNIPQPTCNPSLRTRSLRRVAYSRRSDFFRKLFSTKLIAS